MACQIWNSYCVAFCRKSLPTFANFIRIFCLNAVRWTRPGVDTNKMFLFHWPHCPVILNVYLSILYSFIAHCVIESYFSSQPGEWGAPPRARTKVSEAQNARRQSLLSIRPLLVGTWERVACLALVLALASHIAELLMGKSRTWNGKGN